MRKLTFKHALTPRGIVADCEMGIDADGRIVELGRGGPPYDGSLALPGMPNAHSHAFQRALAGYGEARRGDDSFWSWRDAMYALAARVTPEQMHAIARLAFAEMLMAGFTAVAEFHYLHHLPDGGRSNAMADAVIAAARETGIRLRLLPVYYHAGGFGQDARPEQRRFVHTSVDEYLKFVESIDHPYKGYAPHSLRAVPLTHLRELAGATDRAYVVHIHVSEQETEVEQCIAAYGARPIQLLADTVPLDDRWVLVHATHADADERAQVRDAGACVALCPLTEAYLGDGIFDAAGHHHAGGVWGIGSDSNARIDAIEELRCLEYGQRLRARRRAQLSDGDGIGAGVWTRAAAGGAQATGFDVGRIEIGAFADLVVLDDAAPWAGVTEPARRLDAWLTGGTRQDVAAVYVGGTRVALDFDHIRDAYAAAVRGLRS